MTGERWSKQRPKITLITGANGEMGHGLIRYFAQYGGPTVVAMDVQELDAGLRPLCAEVITGDIRDRALLDVLNERYDVEAIYHLAALLSTSAERNPALAHAVNVDGTFDLLALAAAHGEAAGQPVLFMFPSSIAVYGLPDLAIKHMAGAVREDQYTQPHSLYGVTKLHCEQLGRYFSTFYKRFELSAPVVDFRALRFPGLISALTVPSGGTSDYGPEMLHYAAQGKPYTCFVREDTVMPFMVMDDGIRALLGLAGAEREQLTQHVYNVTSFSPRADEIAAQVRQAFPAAEITFAPDVQRQAIVDGWPMAVDDSAARRDWGWEPEFGFEEALAVYLLPAVRERYAVEVH